MPPWARKGLAFGPAALFFARDRTEAMMFKYGPTRGELWFRLVVSVLGLAFLAAALWMRGLPEGPGLVEVVGVASALFGGTLVWAGKRLIRREHP